MITIGNVFQKIETAAEGCKLSPRETNTLRLLGEEMFSMTDNLVNINDVDFFVTSEEKNFELHLIAKANISPEKKKEFVETSTHGRNESERGLKGKIKALFSDLFYFDPMDFGAMQSFGVYAGTYGHYHTMWSMEQYINDAPLEKQKDDWDGLEKSILIHMSDDILIGATTQQVEMIVKKAFK